MLPNSWSYTRIQTEFNCSRSNAFAARNHCENSIDEIDVETASTNKRGNKPLILETKQVITNFYEDDMNSRQLSGMKDCKSVKKDDGTREMVQKRFILCNIRELYASFKKENPTIEIKFAKFASLRPQHCVMAGSSGTHTVCVCILHQNLKLMLEGDQSSIRLQVEWFILPPLNIIVLFSIIIFQVANTHR